MEVYSDSQTFGPPFSCIQSNNSLSSWLYYHIGFVICSLCSSSSVSSSCCELFYSLLPFLTRPQVWGIEKAVREREREILCYSPPTPVLLFTPLPSPSILHLFSSKHRTGDAESSDWWINAFCSASFVSGAVLSKAPVPFQFKLVQFIRSHKSVTGGQTQRIVFHPSSVFGRCFFCVDSQPVCTLQLFVLLVKSSAYFSLARCFSLLNSLCP